ncbi:hypothetical protein HFP05_09445, partial [Rhodanobacter denitrificans]|nr:hypothetical protein [Rhodanobacter denitrificans]
GRAGAAGAVGRGIVGRDLADIPDIAMPDADATPHLVGATPMPQATLQVVHGIG